MNEKVRKEDLVRFISTECRIGEDHKRIPMTVLRRMSAEQLSELLASSPEAEKGFGEYLEKKAAAESKRKVSARTAGTKEAVLVPENAEKADELRKLVRECAGKNDLLSVTSVPRFLRGLKRGEIRSNTVNDIIEGEEVIERDVSMALELLKYSVETAILED